MAKIYVSYTTRDDDFARELMASLQQSGHEITVEGTRLNPGINWRQTLNDGLKAAEVFIILISQSTMHSQFPMMELGIARSMAENSGLLIVPIVLGDLPLPTIVQDIQVIFQKDRPAADIVPQLNQAIGWWTANQQQQEVARRELAQAVQVNLAEFVDEAIKTQADYERVHKLSAAGWYRTGFWALVGGLISTALLILVVVQTPTATPDYARALSLSFLNVVAIGLFAAVAKYAYSLGKSYMSESLKSSDRIHAIQFGKFYLRAFGSKANTAEVKEVFQHWNIDRTSTFSALDSAQIDPQIISMVTQVVSSVMGKKDK